jgi:hypothetical protein
MADWQEITRFRFLSFSLSGQRSLEHAGSARRERDAWVRLREDAVVIGSRSSTGEARFGYGSPNRRGARMAVFSPAANSLHFHSWVKKMPCTICKALNAGFQLLLITVKFPDLSTPANPRPNALSTLDYCSKRLF